MGEGSQVSIQTTESVKVKNITLKVQIFWIVMCIMGLTIIVCKYAISTDTYSENYGLAYFLGSLYASNFLFAYYLLFFFYTSSNRFIDILSFNQDINVRLN